MGKEFREWNEERRHSSASMWHMSGRLRQEDYEVSLGNRMGFCHR